MAVSRAKVILAEYLSPTIRWFRLQTLEPLPSRFYAGQWLDLHIPMTDRVVVTGYSMCSSPQQFLKSGQLDLAVKRSDDSAASWMHDECAVGVELSYRFGGKVFLDEGLVMKEPDSSYLLIAGGVGINPIYSILLSLIATDTNVNISMLYSAKSKDELVFSKDIVELNHQARNMSVKYFVTQCQGGISTESTAIHARRIGKEDLSMVVEKLSKDKLCVFICGPDSMIRDTSSELQALGIPETNIHYELWW